MNPPGWYPDPAGIPNSFRWWDGQNWSSATTTTPATTPPPQNAAPQAGPGMAQNGPGMGQGGPEMGPGTPVEPGKRGGKPVIIGIVAAAVALVLVVVGVFVVPRFLGDGEEADPTPPVDPSNPTSGGPQSPGADPSNPGGPAELNCAGGNQNSTSSQSPIYSAGGLQYEAPEDWGFRFDKSQWTWLDDQAVWGTIDVEPKDEEWAAGVALGGVQIANGFNDPKSAAANVVECMTSYGFLNDGSWKATEKSGEDVTVAGLKGHRAHYLITNGEGSYPGFAVVVLVLDTGREGSFGTWMSFGPEGESKTAEQIKAAEESIAGN